MKTFLVPMCMSDFIDTVLSIDNEPDAAAFFNRYIAMLGKHHNLDTAVKIAQSNIGWCFGEGMPIERKEMWYRLCSATHPVFGTSDPTPEQAYNAGRRIGVLLINAKAEHDTTKVPR